MADSDSMSLSEDENDDNAADDDYNPPTPTSINPLDASNCLIFHLPISSSDPLTVSTIIGRLKFNDTNPNLNTCTRSLYNIVYNLLSISDHNDDISTPPPLAVQAFTIYNRPDLTSTTSIEVPCSSTELVHCGHYFILPNVNCPPLHATTSRPYCRIPSVSNTNSRKSSFAKALKKRDKGCCITGIHLQHDGNPNEVWEGHDACHIFPLHLRDIWLEKGFDSLITDMNGPGRMNSQQNGIMLEATLHRLFDNFRVGIDVDANYAVTSFGFAQPFTQPWRRNRMAPWARQQGQKGVRNALLRWHFRMCVLKNVKAGSPESQEQYRHYRFEDATAVGLDEKRIMELVEGGEEQLCGFNDREEAYVFALMVGARLESVRIEQDEMEDEHEKNLQRTASAATILNGTPCEPRQEFEQQDTASALNNSPTSTALLEERERAGLLSFDMASYAGCISDDNISSAAPSTAASLISWSTPTETRSKNTIIDYTTFKFTDSSYNAIGNVGQDLNRASIQYFHKPWETIAESALSTLADTMPVATASEIKKETTLASSSTLSLNNPNTSPLVLSIPHSESPLSTSFDLSSPAGIIISIPESTLTITKTQPLNVSPTKPATLEKDDYDSDDTLINSGTAPSSPKIGKSGNLTAPVDGKIEGFGVGG